MKRIILFFTVCLGLSVSQTTFADNAEIARAATKRTSTSNISVSGSVNRASSVDSVSRESQSGQNSRGTTKLKQQKVVTRTANQPQIIKTRNTNTQQKNTSSVNNVVPRLSNATRNTTNTHRVDSRHISDTHQTPAITRSIARKNATRAAEINTAKLEDIKSANYSQCKTIYFECMDEFCANKDANLRRCACSSRIHEFDGIKKQLSDAEDKMLDFNQRLLTVSLDKEDAAAINVATEGELAFNKKDTSESEKLLKKITDTLNNSGNSKLNNNLASISLSLDMDTAWDSVDSLSGIATTSKNGVDLYNAARPVCVEMAREVCSDEELSIAQSSYQLTIQQDCNTVAKSYDTLYNKAIEKIHESSALLDMSRLNNYQQRNSDDTLTCKKKILAQLSDASVCGTNLYKCLDMTGEYIDPSTGEAFLSENLYNLTNLIQEPVADEKWSKIDKNEAFVNFLNSKKKFLEPAIAQCDDIADNIWKEFLDDALSQIKLAQNSKLEEIRQSCTTLVAECKTNAMDDLSEFDARALSTFNVLADATVNEMCSSIENACISLMDRSGSPDYWSTGIIGISTDITYNSIIDTCSQVGRDCIIQKCNGTAGNFALCQDIGSDNRIDILNRNVCWAEVLGCVAKADNLENMSNLPIVADRESYYESVYSNINTATIPTYCTDSGNSTAYIACLITEQIWGTCNSEPSTSFVSENTPNQILIPDTESTLLSWLATNTGTTDDVASCSVYGCPAGYEKVNGSCQIQYTERTNDCGAPTSVQQIINVINGTLTNYCGTGVHDEFGNCCTSGVTSTGTNESGICIPSAHHNAILIGSPISCPASNHQLCLDQDTPTNPREISIYCITPDPDENSASCPSGILVIVDQYGNYAAPNEATTVLQMGYKKECSNCRRPVPKCVTCESSFDLSNGWSFTNTGNAIGDCNEMSSIPTDNQFSIIYNLD